jgi:hypothetical protein
MAVHQKEAAASLEMPPHNQEPSPGTQPRIPLKRLSPTPRRLTAGNRHIILRNRSKRRHQTRRLVRNLIIRPDRRPIIPQKNPELPMGCVKGHPLNVNLTALRGDVGTERTTTKCKLEERHIFRDCRKLTRCQEKMRSQI